MSEFELIQSRVISGKGVLRIPTNDVNNRSYVLFADVVRQPVNKYANFNYNPAKGKYGFLTFLRDGYVIDSASIDYPRQGYDGINDISGQTLIALKCANNAILQSIYNLSVALAATPGGAGLTPIIFSNVLADYTNLRLSWNECRLVCYADTAVQLRLYALKYDTCNADFDLDIPAPMPPLPTTYPPGTPIAGISNGYDGSTDGGNTAPFPGDTPPPVFRECTITYDYNDLYDSSQSGTGRVSPAFSIFTPIIIGTVTYSNNGSRPPGSPRKSTVQVTGSDGNSQEIELINNSFNGHSVTNLTSDCQ